MRRPLVLVIRDGWAIAKDHRWDATYHAATPNHDRLFAKFGYTQLACSGRDVGLPDGVMGNSEVGHTNIGAGRIVVQESLHIREQIRSGAFFRNPALTSVMRYCKSRGVALHLMGLCSDGIVHSDLAHLEALLKMAREAGIATVFVHCFLDGRDTPPRSAKPFLETVERWCRAFGASVATVIGRYWAMDRDRRWQRTASAYMAIAEGRGEYSSPDAVSALTAAYQRGETDEFVKPTVIAGYSGMETGCGVVFFNFRADRARQLTKALVLPDFAEFERPRFVNPHFVSFTPYEKGLPVPHAFELPPINNNLGEVVSRAGLRQFRTAETEKYAHVTYFFNSGREEPYPNEDRLLIPSPKVATYDLKPEMSARYVTEQLLQRLPHYDFVVVNYANGDMVGHTGVFEAAVRACEVVDECVGKVVEATTALGGVCIITADHGNCEVMKDENGTPHTYHTTNPVHFCVVDPQKVWRYRSGGRLADIAPTVLFFLGLDVPPQMTGRNLVLED